MADEHKFCVRCGAALDEDDRFCPSCGERVPGMNPEQVAEEKAMVRSALDSRLRWPIIMMMLYAIPFLILAVSLVIKSDYLVEFIMNSADSVDGMTIDEDLARHTVNVLTVAYFISSFSAIVSSICCYKKKYYWVAVVTCFISLFTGIAGFFALFMGMFALLQIITSKLGFEEYSTQLESRLDKIR